jgi:hypothetical protein
MAKFVEIAEHTVTLSDQMEDDTNGAVILFNKFNVNPDEVKSLWKHGRLTLKCLKSNLDSYQPSYIGVLQVVMYSLIKQSAAALKKAVGKVDLQSRLSSYPAKTVISPHLFRKVAYNTRNKSTLQVLLQRESELVHLPPCRMLEKYPLKEKFQS